MREIIINNNKYEIIVDYKEALDKELLSEKITDFFDDYDFIVGDWAYGKLRLKGFYSSDNKKCKKINDISNLDAYINNNCAYGCRWFQVKRVK